MAPPPTGLASRRDRRDPYALWSLEYDAKILDDTANVTASLVSINGTTSNIIEAGGFVAVSRRITARFREVDAGRTEFELSKAATYAGRHGQ